MNEVSTRPTTGAGNERRRNGVTHVSFHGLSSSLISSPPYPGPSGSFFAPPFGSHVTRLISSLVHPPFVHRHSSHYVHYVPLTEGRAPPERRDEEGEVRGSDEGR